MKSRAAISGNQPDQDSCALVAPGGRTNRFKAFDKRISDLRCLADQVTYTIAHGGAFDERGRGSLHRGGTARDRGQRIRSTGGFFLETYSLFLTTPALSNWYTYFFSPVGVPARGR